MHPAPFRAGVFLDCISYSTLLPAPGLRVTLIHHRPVARHPSRKIKVSCIAVLNSVLVVLTPVSGMCIIALFHDITAPADIPLHEFPVLNFLIERDEGPYSACLYEGRFCIVDGVCILHFLVVLGKYVVKFRSGYPRDTSLIVPDIVSILGCSRCSLCRSVLRVS